MNTPRLDDTDIEGPAGVSIDDVFENALLRQTPEVQQAIRQQAEREGRSIDLVLVEWMRDGRAT